MIGFIAAIFAGYALLWAWLWWRSRFPWRQPPARAREEHAAGTLETVRFAAIDGTLLEGWLVRPHAAKPPLVIMAPGLTATKEGLLEAFAWRFAAEGIATLMFDYRCFGGSAGTPRHWVDLARHQQDYEAALRFARDDLHAQQRIDRDRIALWGSSFSGGTVLVTAACHDEVRAVIAQGPYLETTAALQPTGISMARYVVRSLIDVLPFFPPVYIPVFGRPGEWAFAPSEDNPSVKDFNPATGCDFWQALPNPMRGGWENRMLARMLTRFDDLVPMNSVRTLRTPLLLVAAEHDDLIPLELVQKAYEQAPARTKELLVLPCAHFDLYLGPESVRNRDVQARFLARQLEAERS